MHRISRNVSKSMLDKHRYQVRNLSYLNDNTKKLLKSMLVHIWPKNEPKTKLRIVASVGLLISAKVLTIAVPFLFKDLVDGLKDEGGGGDEEKKNKYVSKLIGTTAGLTVVLYGFARASSVALQELRDVVFSTVSQEAVRKTALKTFEHLHSLDLQYHLSRQTGAVTRIMDRGSKSIDAFLKMLVFRIFPTGIELTLVTGALASQLGPQFALASIATLVSYSIFTVLITNWRTQFRINMNRLDNKASTRSIDSLLNYETVKLFGNEKYESTVYDKILRSYQNSALKSQNSLALLNLGQNLIFTSGLTFMTYLVVDGIGNGQMTVGDLVLVNGLLAQLAIPLNFVGTIFRETRQSLTDMEEMYKLLNQKPRILDKENAIELVYPMKKLETNTVPAIEFENVFFRYEPTSYPILNGISFKILPGQTVGFVGPSGCGKSTLLRLLFRFFDTDSGQVKVFGNDVKDVTQSSLRSLMAVVPQDVVLFNDTLYHNIAYGKLSATSEEVRNVAKRAQLEPMISRLPNGYDTMVGEMGNKVSGGERQRISIARAMLKDSPVLLCDEATSSLDGRTETEIMSSLKLLGNDRTTIMVAHRLATIQDADHIFVMDKGSIVETGNHLQLMNIQSGLYKKMWESQKELLSRI